MLTVDPKTLRSIEDRLQKLCVQDMMEIKLAMDEKLEDEVKQVT